MSGTSEIAYELALLYLSKRTTLLIHGRNKKRLDDVVDALKKTEPEANVVALPTMNLVNPNFNDMPKHDDSNDPNYESIYDNLYHRWFDLVVHEHGLPSKMIIAGGGSTKSDSGTVELNAVSAIKCCENYVRKINENAHQEKYKNRRFNIVYMNSFLGERPDFWEKEIMYAQSKRCVKDYLAKLRSSTEGINLSVQNAIIGPINTGLLRRFYKRMNNPKMGALESAFYQMNVMFLPLITTSPEEAAKHIKRGIESGQDEFFVPNMFAYMPYLLDAGPWLLNFVLNGILFALIFVPSYRNSFVKAFRSIFRI